MKAQSVVPESFTLTDLGIAFPGGSSAYGVDDRGDVAGQIVIGNPGTVTHAAIFENGAVVDLRRPGELEGTAYGFVGHRAVGTIMDPLRHHRAVIWSGTDPKDLGSLGGDQSYAYAANAAGHIIGASELKPMSSIHHAFLWANGVMKNLGTLGGSNSAALSISNSGLVVGYANLKDGSYHACSWSRGSTTDLGTLGGSHSEARAVNNADQIVGVSLDGASHSHAFLFTSSMRDINPPGMVTSEAAAINDRGWVVGTGQVSDGNNHGFLYANGQWYDLNSCLSTPATGWIIEAATGINSYGQITGYGNLNGIRHAFLMTPSVRLHQSPSPQPRYETGIPR